MTAGNNFLIGCEPVGYDLFSISLQRRSLNVTTSLQTISARLSYYDYRTLEYRTDWPQTNRYFEMTRGMDKSFGL